MLQNQATLDVINSSGTMADILPLEQIVQMICEHELPNGNVAITLLICESARMRELNRSYRGKDSDTDVLSFKVDPMPQISASGGIPSLMGDIVVDINQADKQKGSHSLQTELQHLLIHGLLHIFGYDHIKKQDKEIMEHKEEFYLKKLTGAH